MNNNDIFSDSKKYKVTIEKDNSDEQTTYTIFSSVEGETKHEKDKYKIVKVINVETGNIIYTYKQFNSHSPINTFVKLGGQEWWFGGRDYMLKLFVNCDTCQVYDDPNKREFSNSYKSGSEFIWSQPLVVSPNGHFMFVNGCMWSFPNEWRLYDIRNMTTNTTISCDGDEEGKMIHPTHPPFRKASLPSELVFESGVPYGSASEARNLEPPSVVLRTPTLECEALREKRSFYDQIDLYDYLTIKEFDKDDERYEYESYWLGDDEMFTFEFVTDVEITVKYYHNKEWKYFNTIDLSNYLYSMILNHSSSSS